MSHVPAEKLAALLKLSHELGREDRGLAMLGEGNTSCRLDDETFLVKASGSSLANLQEDQLVACRFSALLPLLQRGPDDRCRRREGTPRLARRSHPAQAFGGGGFPRLLPLAARHRRGWPHASHRGQFDPLCG